MNKKKKFVYVNATEAMYPLVKECLESFGFKLTDSETSNLIYWVNCAGSIDFASNLLPWQFYNHFPGMWVLTRKVELARSLEFLKKTMPNEYNFHPISYILPGQFSELKSFMLSISEKSQRTFIIKPDRGSLGKGIILAQDPSDLEKYTDVAIAQQYITPYLVDNLKFDLRIYVLVTSIDPLRIYINREGLARFCTEEYEAPNDDNLDRVFGHLTNYSLNKKNENFQENNIIINQNAEEIEKGHKRSMSSVFERIRKDGIDIGKIQNDIDELIRLTIAAVQPFLSCQYRVGISANDGKSRCFEILGFDVLLDKNAKPWLLEVNCKPAMGAESELDREIKTSVIHGALTILQLYPGFKKDVKEQQKAISQKRISGNSEIPIKQMFDPDAESEVALTTSWRQLFPLTNNTRSSIVSALNLSKQSSVGGAITNTTTRVRKEAVEMQMKTREPVVIPKTPQNGNQRIPRPKMSIFTRQKPKKLTSTKSVINPPRCAFKQKTIIEPYNATNSLVYNANDEEIPLYLHFRMAEPRMISESEERDRLRYLRAQQMLANTVSMSNKTKSIINYISEMNNTEPRVGKDSQKKAAFKPIIVIQAKL